MVYLEKVYRAFGYSGREFLRFAWREVAHKDLVVVEAPTGYGKTVLSQAFSLLSLSEGLKSVIGYPLRSLLEDQVFRFKELMERLGLGDLVGTRYMHHLDSYYFVKPVTLTTIDTLSMCLFGLEPRDLDKIISHYLADSITRTLGHYLFSRATVLLSNIVLDETHLLADSSKSINFLGALIIIARQNGLKLLLESATLPEALIDSLKSIQEDISVVRFDESIDPSFVEERERKEINYSDPLKTCGDKYSIVIRWLREARDYLREDGLRALIVFNTVREALEMYTRLLNSEFRDYKIMLLHSRFTEKDRRSRIDELRGLMGALKNKLRERESTKSIEYIVVATQVIEAGVDISSNVFITDIAPANSLIQRLGRFLRYSGENRGFLRIWYEDVDDEYRYKVYNKELVERTLTYLRGYKGFNPHIPRIYRGLLNNVYRREDFIFKYSKVSEFVSLTLTLKSPERAVKKFLELSGSFIRESVMVPVIAEKDVSSNEVYERIIPLGINSLKPRLIVGKLVKREKGLELVEFDKRIYVERKTMTQYIIREALSSGFVALVVKGEYDPLKGLILTE